MLDVGLHPDKRAPSFMTDKQPANRLSCGSASARQTIDIELRAPLKQNRRERIESPIKVEKISDGWVMVWPRQDKAQEYEIKIR